MTTDQRLSRLRNAFFLASAAMVLVTVIVAVIPKIKPKSKTIHGKLTIWNKVVGEERRITVTPLLTYPGVLPPNSSLELRLDLHPSDIDVDRTIIERSDGGYKEKHERTPYARLDAAERRAIDEIMSGLKARARVAVAGADVEPSGEVPISLDGTFSWSIRPKNEGHYSGRILLRGSPSSYAIILVDPDANLLVSFDAQRPTYWKAENIVPASLSIVMFILGLFAKRIFRFKE